MTTLGKLIARHQEYCEKMLALDLTRGKPAPLQTDLSAPMLALSQDWGARRPDPRNYGEPLGTPEARTFFGAYLGVPPESVIMGNNSSLALMHDIVVQAMLRGMAGHAWVWGVGRPIFLCPVPGYDRHFTITERYGIQMAPVELGPDGPDMDCVEDLVKNPHVVGMWCVPQYSNPTGITYSPEVVERMAHMHVANPGFRLFWDNAYAVHDLYPSNERVHNVWETCRTAGNPERPILFGSTSKVTIAGAGICAAAMGPETFDWFRTARVTQTIGPDKLNELRHLAFLPDLDALAVHMERHAAILRPKFELVERVLAEHLTGQPGVFWTKPRGGYFVNVEVPTAATRTVLLAKEAGVALTPAGASFPYGNDPYDQHVRIAPTFPSLTELETAMQVLVLCIKIAVLEQHVAYSSV